MTRPANFDPLYGSIASGGVGVIAGGGSAGGGSTAWKRPVRALADEPLNLATDLVNTASIGGVTVATGDRVLVATQTDASDNGIYVVAASGAASRASDATTGVALLGAVTMVMEGTYAAQVWTCRTADPITVGTTDLTWAELRAYPRLRSELLVEDGATSPPVPLYTEDGTDFLYGLVE